MSWSKISEAIIAILTAGLIVYIIQLFLPDDHKRKTQKVLGQIIKYLL